MTFDDGPDSIHTSKIIDILRDKDVKATFFMLGNQIKTHTDITELVFSEGHCIANHTSSHLMSSELAADKYFENVDRTEKLIDSLFHVSHKLFRPPWGILTDDHKQILRENGYKIILWDVDSEDHDIVKYSPQDIINKICTNVRNNSILLFHDADNTYTESRQNTVDALPIIIDSLQVLGYEFLTIDQYPGIENSIQIP